jgi:DNA repair protein SbcC/Rad50
MIIQSIRLKHIKSYGVGPDEKGVTISFENGVNRVAGRNGHGKTTLIESIGYALFLTEPQFEENFQIETYFLSHGAKEGEIDVTFSCDGESYRIERAVGKQPKRRAKVIQLSDQSICAEGDQEVSVFLCRLLKFPDAGHMSEVFCKLVGVKQGRLAWPFDSKSTEAKRYFEPLLEVDVFRNCFDRLKGAVDAFESQKVEQITKRAAIDERIQERADSQSTFAAAKEKVHSTATSIEEANLARDAAQKLKDGFEALDKAVTNSRTVLASATEKASHAKAQREAAQTQHTESKDAVVIVANNEIAHKAHTEANEALTKLGQQRIQRDQLKQQRDNAEAERISHQSKATAAVDQAKEFSSQRDVKQKECDALACKIKPLEETLEKTAAHFQKTSDAVDEAKEHRDTVGGWIDGLAGLVKNQKRTSAAVGRLTKEISAWDAAKLKAAVKTEKEAASALKTAHDKLAKAEQQQATSKDQLDEISGGVCPFLKEKCRQFDPAKVQADLKTQSGVIAGLKKDVEKAEAAHQTAESSLGELRSAEGGIKGKVNELGESLESFGDGMQSLTAEEVAKSIKWFSKWESKISALPSSPKIPHQELDASAVVKLQQELEIYLPEANAWWEQADSVIKGRLKEFSETEKNRKAQETTLKQFSEQLVQLKTEHQGFIAKIATKESEAQKHNSEAARFGTNVGKLDEGLKPFVQLDIDLNREQSKRDANRIGHECYLGAKKLADDLSQRQSKLEQLQSAENVAQQALETARVASQKAEQEFDPEKLKAARADHQSKHDRVTTLKVSLKAEEDYLRKEEKRFNEWEAACRDRAVIAAEIGRCEAAIEITELARKTLRDTAPAVAQHLCNRIAARAQRVFNQINPEPIELAWEAERYGLHITPGDRRFAMLSGGEQTKLALAMTLAMIEEFSGLQFCIFDEPTYGVDADSRHKLADAILQAQEAAGLDQLLLVSHDDAFEGKIEHAILLEKSAIAGTQVALSL